jgi:quinolinate synthase
MAKFAQQDDSSEYIIVTECGMTNKLREDLPGKTFFSFCNFCPYMKIITLQSVYDSLLHNQFEIKLDENIRIRAKKAIDKMIAVS